MRIILKADPTKPHWPVILLMTAYVILAIYLGVFLHYDFLRSDVASYWRDSLVWQTPYDRFHVPGYPWLIAVLRGITFGIPSPIGLMMSINLGAFLIGAFIVYKILQASGASDALAAIGVLCFGLWPLTGITYTVNPLADVPAITFFLAGLYMLQRSHRLPAAFLFGFSMITHKAMWLVVGLPIVFGFFYHRKCISKRHVGFVAVVLLPIGILWLFGSYYHRSVTWLLLSNLHVEVASQGSTPVFDGVLGTLMEGDIKGLAKGIVLVSLALVSVATVYLSTRLKYKYFCCGMAISMAILVLLIVLNQHEIWAAMRFGRILVIPLALIANTTLESRMAAWWRSPVIITLLLLLLLSQFAFAWYMVLIYAG